MFLKFFLDLYDYLKGVLGLKSKEKLGIENTMNIIQEEEEMMLSNKNYEEYNDYKEYTPLELVAKNPYSRQANSAHSIKQTKSHNIPKSHNELVKIFYCGYCSRYIPTPIHMYNDKAYCSSSCRNRQYDNDYQQQRHIRSISSSF